MTTTPFWALCLFERHKALLTRTIKAYQNPKVLFGFCGNIQRLFELLLQENINYFQNITSCFHKTHFCLHIFLAANQALGTTDQTLFFPKLCTLHIGQVSAWQSADKQSVQHVPVVLEEPLNQVRPSSSGGATNNPLFPEMPSACMGK